MQQGVVAVSHEFGKNTNIRDDQKKNKCILNFLLLMHVDANRGKSLLQFYHFSSY